MVATVGDGAAACRAVQAHVPDVLLLEVSLPDMSGFALVEIRRGAPVRVVFITAYSAKAYAGRAFEAGAKGYVSKGAIDVELPAAIGAMMSLGVCRSPRVY